jgi:hypothetical protein
MYIKLALTMDDIGRNEKRAATTRKFIIIDEF